ncbi:uncharacterized protein EAE98_006833 [Botrytis deweyae]|uniref:Isochorismatase-like domain-containing protein n=1 Tax=Botrytis deweyae TaxID=2478750 RepID=A0ABQ7IJ46_9HELO|nr:uncharacterized protein EAE98_006833 [Botrytis deweyae]KAF7925608.1 hypothetical protein EAE98_006833 [Botrytis deweyae]
MQMRMRCNADQTNYSLNRPAILHHLLTQHRNNLIENGKIIDPYNLPHPVIFLSGTTNYNKDESRWQEVLTDRLLARSRSTSTDDKNVTSEPNSFAPVTIIDPYNPAWDSTWREDLSDEKFVTQVNFELEGLELADIVVVGFIGADVRAGKIGAGGTALLELGMALKSKGQKVIVCVEKGFWKEGYVKVLCERFGVQCLDSLSMVETIVGEGVDSWESESSQMTGLV